MNKKTPNFSSANDLSRCQHRTATNRRCRLPVTDTRSRLCFRHAQLQQQKRDAADLSADLVGQLARFNSASDIHQLLSNLLLLLSQNRISPRRAAVLAYISQLLLRTLPAIALEVQQKSVHDHAPPTILINVPRPQRPRPLPPAP